MDSVGLLRDGGGHYIAVDEEHLLRVIQIPREAYVAERLAEVAKQRTRAPPEGEPDSLVSGGTERVGGGR